MIAKSQPFWAHTSTIAAATMYWSSLPSPVSPSATNRTVPASTGPVVESSVVAEVVDVVEGSGAVVEGSGPVASVVVGSGTVPPVVGSGFVVAGWEDWVALTDSLPASSVAAGGVPPVVI